GGGDTLVVDDLLGYGSVLRVPNEGVLLVGADTLRRHPPPKLPSDPPAAWKGLIGEYRWGYSTLYILEKHGRLTALIQWFYEYPLTPVAADTFAFPNEGLYDGERLVFTRDAAGRASQVSDAGVVFKRRPVPGEDGDVFRITPVKPVEELRR